MKDLSNVAMSGKWLAVCLDDPVVAEPEGTPSNSREESAAALAALEAEGEDFGEWEIAQMSAAALEEFNSNGGDIQNMGLVNGVIYASTELSNEEAAGD